MTAPMPSSDQNKSDRKSRFVLVVDSDAKNLAFLSKLLLRFNYQFIHAATGEETLDMATIIVPCLAIISLELPGMTGLELIQQLSRNSATNHIPVVGLLQKDNADEKKRCYDNGAIGSLYRPIDPEALYRTIQVAVEKNPRSSMRVRTVQPVRLKNGGQRGLSGAHTLDLSARGMFLRTTHSVSVDTKLSLQLDLSGRTISTEALVLYKCNAGEGPYREPGIGLRFVEIAPKDQEFIRQFIKDDVTRGIAPGFM